MTEGENPYHFANLQLERTTPPDRGRLRSFLHSKDDDTGFVVKEEREVHPEVLSELLEDFKENYTVFATRENLDYWSSGIPATHEDIVSTPPLEDEEETLENPKIKATYSQMTHYIDHNVVHQNPDVSNKTYRIKAHGHFFTEPSYEDSLMGKIDQIEDEKEIIITENGWEKMPAIE